jgi:hypothetical protein
MVAAEAVKVSGMAHIDFITGAGSSLYKLEWVAKHVYIT